MSVYKFTFAILWIFKLIKQDKFRPRRGETSFGANGPFWMEAPNKLSRSRLRRPSETAPHKRLLGGEYCAKCVWLPVRSITIRSVFSPFGYYLCESIDRRRIMCSGTQRSVVKTSHVERLCGGGKKGGGEEWHEILWRRQNRFFLYVTIQYAVIEQLLVPNAKGVRWSTSGVCVSQVTHIFQKTKITLQRWQKSVRWRANQVLRIDLGQNTYIISMCVLFNGDYVVSSNGRYLIYAPFEERSNSFSLHTERSIGPYGLWPSLRNRLRSRAPKIEGGLRVCVVQCKSI